MSTTSVKQKINAILLEKKDWDADLIVKKWQRQLINKGLGEHEAILLGRLIEDALDRHVNGMASNPDKNQTARMVGAILKVNKKNPEMVAKVLGQAKTLEKAVNDIQQDAEEERIINKWQQQIMRQGKMAEHEAGLLARLIRTAFVKRYYAGDRTSEENEGKLEPLVNMILRQNRKRPDIVAEVLKKAETVEQAADWISRIINRETEEAAARDKMAKDTKADEKIMRGNIKQWSKRRKFAKAKTEVPNRQRYEDNWDDKPHDPGIKAGINGANPGEPTN